MDNFSLDIYGGEILCLLGNNGSGKTTLINLLTGLIEPEVKEGGDAWIHSSTEDKISMRDQPGPFRSFVRLCQ
jgi:ABC-type multidrug transport system ATPase subunit